ncbi:MAG: GFA family protein [Burkholderiales bacterium]
MKKTYKGSCHCGAVRFEADIDLAQGTFRCNSSICFKTRAWLAAIPASDFRLLSGEQGLHDYQFGKKIIHHRFCTQCGVRPFSQVSDPKGNKFCAVRVNCLDGVDPQELIDAPLKYFNMLHDDLKSPPAETRHL